MYTLEFYYYCIYDLDLFNTTEPMEFATVLYNLRISGFIFHEKFNTMLCPSSSKVSASLTVHMHDNKGITYIFKIEPLKFLDWFIEDYHISLQNCGQKYTEKILCRYVYLLSNEYKKKILTIYISAFTTNYV